MNFITPGHRHLKILRPSLHSYLSQGSLSDGHQLWARPLLVLLAFFFFFDGHSNDGAVAPTMSGLTPVWMVKACMGQ